MMAGRMEQIATMSRIDVEEDARNDNSFLFEQFLKECLQLRVHEFAV